MGITHLNKTRFVWYSLELTVVLVVKDNKQLFTAAHHATLKGILSDICEDYSAELGRYEGNPNFVVLRIIQKPAAPGLSKFINVMKSTATRRMNRQCEDLSDLLWDRFYMAFYDDEMPNGASELVEKYFSSRNKNINQLTKNKKIT